MRMPKEKECPLCGYDTSAVEVECSGFIGGDGLPCQGTKLVWKCRRCGYKWTDKPTKDSAPGQDVRAQETRDVIRRTGMHHSHPHS